MPTRRPRSHRQPGRPASGASPEARAALLDAASRLFARHGAAAVSLRRVAAEAGVTPAMVHYYFGGRDGLYDALLERTFARVIERVNALAAAGGEAGKGAAAGESGPADPLAALLELLSGTFLAEPWLPTIVVREVLAEGGRLRERFVRDYASRIAQVLPGLIRSEIEAGRFRDDLDPRLAFLSFLGMTVFPFVARPVVERTLGLDYDADFVRRFVAHTRKLFVEGARA